MQLIIEPGAVVRCIYTESIDLTALGSPAISRASHVEPDEQGCWLADMGLVNGPRSIFAARCWQWSWLGLKQRG